MPQTWSLSSLFSRARISGRTPRRRTMQKLFVEQLERREVLSGSLGLTSGSDTSVTRAPNPGGNDGTGGTGTGSVDVVARYLSGLYRDLLHRWPVQSEIAGWENALASGLTIQQVPNMFVHSAEYDGDAISESYMTILGRLPDAGGLASWTQFLQNGGTLEQFDAQLLGSDEYYALQGSDPGDWLNGLYTDELARLPDAGAQSYWLQALQQGATRTGLALAVINSQEAQTQFVDGAYQEFLGRPPSTADEAYWVTDMQQGLTDSGLATTFAGTDEYTGIQEGNSELDPPYYTLPPFLTGGAITSPTGSSGSSGSSSSGTGSSSSGSGGTSQTPPGGGGTSGTVGPVGPLQTKLPVIVPTSTANPLDHSGYVGSQELLNLLNEFNNPTGSGTSGSGQGSTPPAGSGDGGQTSGAPPSGSGSSSTTTAFPSPTDLLTFVFDASQKAVLVNVRALPAGSDPQTQADLGLMETDLTNLGMTNIQVTAAQDLVTGFLPISAIAQLPSVTDFSAVTPVYNPIHNLDPIDTQGDHAIGADTYRATTGNDGTGVTIGILSDSINQIDSHVTNIPGIGIAQSQSTGDLPARGVNVLKDGSPTDTDEGRGMAEIIYDLAPGANLAFNTSDGGPQAMAQGIQALAKAGSQVIVDDTTYPEEPFFNDGVLAQTVNSVATTDNVAYITSAGNNGNNAWTAGFNPITTTVGTQTGTFQNFGTSSSQNALQGFSLAQGQIINLDFQWDNAFLEGGSNLPQYQVQNNMAVYVTNAAGTQIYATFADDNRNTDEALQRVAFENTGNYGTNQFALAFELTSTAPGATPPTQLKWIRFDNNAPAQFQGAPAIFGHAAAADVLTVGAAPVSQPTAAESFSSQGPATILFDSNGYRQPQPDIRSDKPNIVAPDGVYTANFPGQPAGDPLPPGTFPVFYGTSAAAAEAAAAAALMRQADPGASAQTILSGLEDNATQQVSGTRGPSGGTGLLHVGPLPTAEPPASRLTVGPNVNVSMQTGGSQSEEDIAVDPANPQDLFAFANDNAVINTGSNGMLASYSTDGGATWTPRVLGNGSDGLPPVFTDPSVSWDNFGNLFISGIGTLTAKNNDTLLLSTDGGKTFKSVMVFPNVVDQPKVTTGDGAVWVVFLATDSSSPTGASLQAAGAPVTGLGLVGAFGAFQTIPGSGADGGNFGGITIGPTGQVIVSYQNAGSGAGPDTIFTSTNLTGLGGTFGPAVAATPTNLGGFTPLPPQAIRTVDAEGRPVYDDSTGPNAGRAYLVYTDRPSVTSNATHIYVRRSNDNGATWSAPVQVDDDNTSGNAKFLPRLAVDPTTGIIAVEWYDARNDPAGVQAEIFATISTDGGLTFQPNIQVAAGPSDAVLNQNTGNQYGDYTGLAFYGGIFHPCWTDNSSQLPGNDRPNFSIATASIVVQAGHIGPEFPEDRFDPNETSDTATNFGVLARGFVSVPDLTISVAPTGIYNFDWFRWSAGVTGIFNATIQVSKGGDLELYLFTLRDNTLVELREDTTPNTGTHTISAPVAAGEPLLLEIKGRNVSPGIKDQAAYELDVSLQ